MKRILTIIAILALTSCASTEYSYINKNLRKEVALQKDKIFIKDFDLVLNEKRINGLTSANNITSDYLNTAQMKKLMRNNIISRLKSDDIYSNINDKDSYKYEVFIEVSRNFMAFSSNKYAGLEIKKIDIKVFKNNNLFASKLLEGGFGKGIINCGHNRGFFENLATIVKTVTAQKGVEDERKDVEYCGEAIYNTIKKLGD